MTAAMKHNLGDCPFLPPLESWMQARGTPLNKRRLVRGEPRFLLKHGILQIELPRRETRQHELRMERMIHHDWRRENDRVAGTAIHAEVLCEEEGHGIVMRLIGRAYPEGTDQCCWDLEEVVFLIPAGPILCYEIDEKDVAGPIDLMKHDVDPIMVSAGELGDLCEQAHKFQIICNSCPINLGGLRVGSRVYRTGAMQMEVADMGR